MCRRFLIKLQIYIVLFAALQGCQGSDFDDDDDLEMTGIKISDLPKNEQLMQIKYRALLKRVGYVPLIRINPTDDIQDLICDPPRNFSMILLVVSSFRYKDFTQLTTNLGFIAKSYMDHNTKDVTTFFLEVRYEDHPEIFRIIGDQVRDLPSLYHIPEKGRFSRHANTGRSLGALKPSHITNWIEYEAGLNIPVITDNSIDYFVKIITVFMVLRAIYKNRATLRKLDPQKALGFTAIFGIIAILSGYMFVNITNPPIIWSDGESHWRLVLSGARRQTIAELFIIFALIGSNTIGMFLMLEFGPSTGNDPAFAYLGLFLFSTTISILKWLSLLKSGSPKSSIALDEE